ncbi:ubiquitination pathway protein, partial [Scheffersomyces coipomensis]|uniref:ubiquitination pathway protein n=1 Tax=Scheffersomyces coipomensis TaxID=1788519 RepID=UPI00315D41B7
PPSTTSLAESGSSSLPSGSSSSLTSASTVTHKPKARNVPYRPSEEQQKQIDLLTAKGPAKIPNLRTVTSTTQTDYFDVLPSFQMFQSILRRDDNQFNENLSIRPPEYGDTNNSSPTPPPHLSPRNSSTQIDGVLGEVSERLNEYGLNEDHDDEEEEEYFHDHEHHHSNITYDNHGHSPLDNIDKLPKLNKSPIDIQIFVTKKVPEPHTNNELETRLKEYTSGDMVNGYIIITNKSDKPVNFGLFTVSLEGTVKEAERNLDIHSIDSNRFNKILMKKFLKMYDLNASYGYTHIPSSAGVEYEQYTIDSSDGCQFGLPNERVLQPFKKYKKFFTFKFPEKLLDNSCMHALIPHILPPPSMGFDRTSFFNKGDSIQLNKALGYGFLNVKGTPLITRDYSFEDVSVSYTIEAKFIDKLNSNDNSPLSPDEINDPENPDANKYVISRSNQYFVRFIPDLREQFQYYNLGFQYSPDSFAKSGIDGKLFLDYIHLTTWKNINLENFQIEQEIDLRLSREEMTNEDIKHKNLILDNSDLTRKRSQKISKKHQAYQELQRIDYHNEEEEKQEQKFYQEQYMIGTKIPTQVYGKKKKMILSSLVKIGDSKLYVKVPHKILPYGSPRLLQKYNGTLEEDAGSNHISPSISNTLEPVSSHMSELYNRDENDNISSIDISVIFNALGNDATIKPPQISYIEVNVIYWSYYTEYPLPFELNYDFFYTNPEEDDKKHNDYVEITRKNLQGLKDQVGNYIQFLKSNQKFVSKNSYLYLKSIKSLGIKKDTIKEYYKTITPQSHPDILGNDSWSKANHTKFVKDLTIPLIPINKNNVTLLPSFQNCLVGRIYCLQVVVKYKGNGGNEQNEFADNIIKVDIPILVG